MKTLTIVPTSKVPVYKQLLTQFENGVRNGSFVDGEQVLSMNELSSALNISKETVKKVYSILRDKGYLEARQGKGFYIKKTEKALTPKVLVIFDKLSAYKQTLFNSFSKTINGKADVTILLHNQDVDLFEYYVEQNLGNFDYYVITPHFSLEKETQKQVAKIISHIPNRQLIMADNWMKNIPGNYGAVYQDYSQDVIEGLKQGLRKLRSRGVLHIVNLPNSLYGEGIANRACVFCAEHGIQTKVATNVDAERMQKGDIYLLLNSSLDSGLIAIARAAREKNLKIGKDISIISYNESPISEIVLGGLTTISTDFEQMGRLIAEMILKEKMTKQKCDFKMIRRITF